MGDGAEIPGARCGPGRVCGFEKDLWFQGDWHLDRGLRPGTVTILVQVPDTRWALINVEGSSQASAVPRKPICRVTRGGDEVRPLQVWSPPAARR